MDSFYAVLRFKMLAALEASRGRGELPVGGSWFWNSDFAGGQVVATLPRERLYRGRQDGRAPQARSGTAPGILRGGGSL
jgi:hypothetical protein